MDSLDSTDMLSKRKEKLAQVVHVFRIQQLTGLVFGSAIGVVMLLHAANIIPLTWLWVLCFHITLDTLGEIFTVSSKVLAKCFKKKVEQVEIAKSNTAITASENIKNKI